MLIAERGTFKTVNYDYLARLPDPASMGPRHRPVRHSRFVHDALSAVYGAGMVVCKESFNISDDNMFLYAEFWLDREPNELGVRRTLLLKHDNAKRCGLTVILGGDVQWCTNGCVFGDYEMQRRRHTSGVQNGGLGEWLHKALPELNNAWRQSDVRCKRMADTPELGNAETLLMSLMAGKVLTAKATERAYEEWRNPSHLEFRPRNMWSLYNAITEASKTLAIPRQVGAQRDAFTLIDSVCASLN